MTDNMRGKPPFGYDIAGDRYHRTLVPNAAQQAVAQRMYALSAEGNTREQIAATLNAEGDEYRWSPNAARLVIDNNEGRSTT